MTHEEINSQPPRSINEIMRDALTEVRDVHGMAIYSVSAEWMGTLVAPDSVVSELEVSGTMFAAKRVAE